MIASHKCIETAGSETTFFCLHVPSAAAILLPKDTEHGACDRIAACRARPQRKHCTNYVHDCCTFRMQVREGSYETQPQLQAHGHARAGQLRHWVGSLEGDGSIVTLRNRNDRVYGKYAVILKYHQNIQAGTGMNSGRVRSGFGRPDGCRAAPATGHLGSQEGHPHLSKALPNCRPVGNQRGTVLAAVLESLHGNPLTHAIDA